jgi:tetratricopeptide (TPR) repeat protein
LGRGHLASQQIDEAKQAFNKALEYDKTCLECLNLLDQCRRHEAKVLRVEAEKLIHGKQFDAATATLERVLALTPDDTTASDLLFQSHYQKAMDQYDAGQYLEAKTGFEAAAALNPDCTDCGQFIEDSLNTYKEKHYNDGIAYFGQEKLKEAISSWEKVAAVDPDYKDVQMNLRKATLLNERLEQIRQQIGE